MESTKHLVESMKNSSAALSTFVKDVDDWSRCEPSGSVELHSLRVLSSALSFTIPNVDKVISTVHEEFSEYLDFLEDWHLRSCRDTMEQVLKSFTSSMATSPVSTGSAPSTAPHSGDKHKGEGEAVKGDIHSQAVAVSKAWEAGRAVRSSMLLNQILVTAQTLAGEVLNFFVYLKAGIDHSSVRSTRRRPSSGAMLLRN